ncbi:MAG TPA: cupin domain-containing protein [Flavisolibacter sp.]|nr:cupin domain-containing protein [Flavisolibacter sp.]
MKPHVSIEEAVNQLGKEDKQRFTLMMEYGTMQLEYYAPRDKDHQSPHKKDELYVIVSGSGYINRSGTREEFGAGDVVFVPAGMPHRFEDFTNDFATWVIFYGPEGGE